MPSDPHPAHHRLTRLLPPILLAVAVLCAFWPLSRSEFLILDDGIYVADNPEVQKGISAESLMTSGGGESNPIGDNTTRDGRQMNRRAELVVMD